MQRSSLWVMCSASQGPAAGMLPPHAPGLLGGPPPNVPGPSAGPLKVPDGCLALLLGGTRGVLNMSPGLRLGGWWGLPKASVWSWWKKPLAAASAASASSNSQPGCCPCRGK